MDTAEQERERIEFDIWMRLLEGQESSLSPAAARAILDIKFPEEDIQRMRELSAKARDGALTRSEDVEAEAYGRVGSLLSIMRTKARQALPKST